MPETLSLQSSVAKRGEIVTQIITFVGGYKKTVEGIRTDSIKQSEFTHLETLDGRLILVNPKNVLMVETFSHTLLPTLPKT
jgi:hypothetical protein